MLEIIILGIVQGIAEFLPISSSAHLIIVRDLFGIGQGMSSDLALSFDIALHFGTLIAIAIYFFKDFWNMVIKGITKGPKDTYLIDEWKLHQDLEEFSGYIWVIDIIDHFSMYI